jgi:putative colanic acid biosynthesis acetyltransferase WcaF
MKEAPRPPSLVPVAVDLSAVRNPHSLRHRLARVAWGWAWTLLFRPSPRPLHGWRRALLRLFGARVARTAAAYPRCRIWAPWQLSLGEHATLADDVEAYSVAPIRIEDHATVSQGAMLATASHDIARPDMPLVQAPIVIGRGAWVCARAFVGPGVTVGARAVVGACAVVTSDVPSDAVVVGNPASFLKWREAADGPREA